MGLLDKLEAMVNVGVRVLGTIQDHAANQELSQARSGKTYDGLPLEEWEKRWESLGTLASEGWRGVRDIGLYRALFGSEIMYIGRVVYKQGLHWRLQQYHAGSRAGNSTSSARNIHDNAATLKIDVLRMSTKPAVLALEIALIALHKPPWNEKKGGGRGSKEP